MAYSRSGSRSQNFQTPPRSCVNCHCYPKEIKVCDCGLTPLRSTSRTPDNPLRYFYQCVRGTVQQGGCGLWELADEGGLCSTLHGLVKKEIEDKNDFFDKLKKERVKVQSEMKKLEEEEKKTADLKMKLEEAKKKELEVVNELKLEVMKLNLENENLITKLEEEKKKGVSAVNELKMKLMMMGIVLIVFVCVFARLLMGGRY